MVDDSKKYISISEFIKKAKYLGINLGRGNPQNRIRYYIKTGLLPHQIRLKQTLSSNNIRSTVGHLPVYALALLQKIELLKSQKKSSLVIKQIIGKERLVYETENLGQSFLTNNHPQDSLGKFVTLATLILLIIVAFNLPGKNPSSTDESLTYRQKDAAVVAKQILLPVGTILLDTQYHELLSRGNIIVIDKPYADINSSSYTIQLQNQFPKRIMLTGQNQLIDDSGNIISKDVLYNSDKLTNQTSGTAVIQVNTTSIQIPSSIVTKSSRILVTARSTTENQSLVVTEVKDGFYFTVEIGYPTNIEIYFDWMVVN